MYFILFMMDLKKKPLLAKKSENNQKLLYFAKRYWRKIIDRLRTDRKTGI